MTVKTVRVADLTLDERLQMRDSMDDKAIDEYAEHLDEMPPVEAILDDDGKLLLYDGWHQVYACRRKERPEVKCKITKGTFRDALLLAAGANAIHGVRRTAKDKRKAVKTLLNDEEWGKASDRWIAEACKVSHPMVAEMRKSTGRSSSCNGSTGSRKGKDGKIRNPPVMCERCKRVGKAVDGCNGCRALRKKAEEEKKAKKAADKAKPTEVKDQFGQVVPKGRLDAFKDPWISKTIEELENLNDRLKGSRMADGMLKRKKFYPFFKHQDFVDACGFVMEYFDQMLDHLKNNRPVAVCPGCEGEGCVACSRSGLVPLKVYEELKGAAK